MKDKSKMLARGRAALWSVRMLDGDRRTEERLENWLANDEANADEYAKAQWVLNNLEEAARPVVEASNVRPFRQKTATGSGKNPVWLAAVAAGVAIMVFAGLFGFMREPSWRTGRGEQRVVALSDGTRVILNTDTELRVHYKAKRRDVELVQGEALFDVEHDPSRPFVVDAGSESVRALGTSFVVRSDADRVEVILISGKVEVRNASTSAPVILAPGERLRKSQTGADLRDQPELAVVTAWRNGELVLKDTPVDQAIAEMNRYSVKRIVVRAASPKTGRLSGVFRLSETEEFVRTVSEIYGLTMKVTPQEFVLE